MPHLGLDLATSGYAQTPGCRMGGNTSALTVWIGGAAKIAGRTGASGLSKRSRIHRSVINGESARRNRATHGIQRIRLLSVWLACRQNVSQGAPMQRSVQSGPCGLAWMTGRLSVQSRPVALAATRWFQKR